MPIYGYQCAKCGHEFDKLQKLSEPDLQDCPKCEQPELRRQLSAPNFQLKGSGWYVTDFKDSNKAPTAKNTDQEDKTTAAESKSATETSTKQDAKTDG